MHRLACVVVAVLVSFSAAATPREARGPNGKTNPIVKALRTIVRTLGDGITIPVPASKP